MSVHELKNLACVITTDVDEGMPHENQNLAVLVWRDCGMRIIFPSGQRMDAGPAPSGADLDATIEIALGAIHRCSKLIRPEPPKVRVHKVPAELTTDEQIIEWMQTVPGLVLEFRPGGMGFGGPLPQSGQAG